MSEQKETSRGPELDIVELIANLIASYSHLFELYNANASDIDHYEELWQDELDEKLEENKFLEEQIDKVYRMRKSAMGILKDLSPDYNYQAHCLLKHAIASYQYASELWDTNRECGKYQDLVLDCAQYMYTMLSFYMWVDIATCWRCLKDSLEEKQNPLEQ